MPHQIFAVHGSSTQPLEYSRVACGILGTHPRAPIVESLQEDICVFRFSCWLVLIQHNRLFHAATGAVQPHIGLAAEGMPRFLQHLQGRRATPSPYAAAHVAYHPGATSPKHCLCFSGPVPPARRREPWGRGWFQKDSYIRIDRRGWFVCNFWATVRADFWPLVCKFGATDAQKLDNCTDATDTALCLP